MTKLPKLLIIDDDAHLRESLAEVLELDGFECHQAGAAKEGIAAASKLEPEIVIMDIQLPDIDGIEALRRIREVHELDAMPVVAVSASVMPDDQQKIVTSGFDAFVTKPIHLKHFVDTVKRFLDGGEGRP